MTLKEAWECIVETMNNNKTTQVVIVSKGDPDYDKCLSLDWLVEKFRNAINNSNPLRWGVCWGRGRASPALVLLRCLFYSGICFLPPSPRRVPQPARKPGAAGGASLTPLSPAARLQLAEQNGGKDNGKADCLLQAGTLPVEQHGKENTENRFQTQNQR